MKMIEVSVTTALLFYLGILLFFIFGVWLKSHLSSRGKKEVPPSTELAICEYCQFAYLANRLREVNKCPSCSLLNKKNWYK